ncbi:YicC/YloC family endoribonuclease [Enterococcus sp. HY326]|uniref:YicC/YloC family endoribonuclease n=1 Tax=Enterococcus sp. HY326 TaxID=2971265 RepID=UPI0022407F59|nr:YicC/YloC family endoribonuclease [Enterococcus sp. HY326]
MKSMTGFGKALQADQHYQLDIEMKSVNHRFLDVQIRSPKQVNPFELSIRQLVKEQIQRGRIEIYINLREVGAGSKEVQVQWELLDQLLHRLDSGLTDRQIETKNLAAALLPSLVTQEDYIKVVETNQAAELEELLLTTVQAAIGSLDQSRQKEGVGIQKVLQQYQQDFTVIKEDLASFVSEFEADFRQRFETKLKTWLEDHVAEDRLLTEMALLLERGDIHEELDRLTIHLESLSDLLTKAEPVGRELDFLIQEMNREVNTIGSKSSPIEIKNRVVQMKTILEKIREQVQNVE